MVTAEDTITLTTEPVSDYLDKGPVPFSHPSEFEQRVVDSIKRGEYQSSGEIGRGAEGYVCRLDLRKEDIETRLAVKVVSTRHHSESEIDALCRQAEVVRKLNIPGVQRYLAFEVKDVPQEFGVIDRQYRLFSMYEGETSMAEKKSAASEAEAYTLLQKVLGITAKIHTQEVVHRDLKPSNIRLDQDGNPILVDFGLAKELTERTLTATFGKGMIGSYQYMAPEVLFRGEKPGKAADLYSIGATFVDYLSSEPFVGERTTETMRQRLAQLNIKHYDLSSSLEALLTDDPRERETKCVLKDGRCCITYSSSSVAATVAHSSPVPFDLHVNLQHKKSTPKKWLKRAGVISAIAIFIGGIGYGLYLDSLRVEEYMELRHNRERENKELWDKVVQTASGEDHFLSNDEKKKLLTSLSKEGYLPINQELDWSQKLNINSYDTTVEVFLGRESLGSISHDELEKLVNTK